MYSKEKAVRVIDPENNLSGENKESLNEENNNDINESKEENSSEKDSKEIKDYDDDKYSEHDYSFYNLRELLEKGDLAYSQQKYKKAMDIYKTLINKFPEEVRGYINMGKIYMKLKTYTTALDMYNKSLLIDKTKKDVYINKGV